MRIGHISEINHFVTDAAPPPALRRICEEHGVVLDVAADDGHEGARLGIGPHSPPGLTSPRVPTTL